MTVKEIERRLREAGIENAPGEAMLIAEHFSGIPRSRLLIMKDEELKAEGLSEAVTRREEREPLQYILGEWAFMNEVYEVNPSTLVPREDTEILVTYGIENIPKNGVFLDLCAGSGCVGISTLAARGDLSCISVELYPETLETAKRNAARNGVSDRIKFLLADVTKEIFGEEGIFDAVLTNPPYVTAEEWEDLEEDVKKEPKAALTDGADGLSIIRSILEIYPSHIREGGFIAIEMGAYQGNAVTEIAKENGLSCRILKDYSGKDRVALCNKI
ncbi:MAG: peptide chain release factor N(5)-glutamine methyltransferase [Ruminococcaceae bacterium]|nr:peptide chain release factor N(5)-glutamine methyltransferase [Oscillospiraceae bacterium]